MKKVLVIGRHADMLENVKALLQTNGYESFGATQNEEAIKLFNATKPDAIIIGGGVDFESRNYFHLAFIKINPAVKIIDAHPHTILNDLKKAFS
jgi:PleD family two-component response regulator